MALNTQLDSAQLKGAALPYNKILRELDTTPHIVAGQNMLSTVGGKLIKRPGCTAIASTTLNYRIDRLVVYETLDSPQRVYLLASAFTGTYWEMFYIRLGVTTWTSLGSLRSLNQSTKPHEITTARGYAYIKGFPGGTEKYGSAIFNGASGAVYTTLWGLEKPTVAARLSGSVETLLSGISATDTAMTGQYGNLPTGKYVDIGEETIYIVSVSGVYNYTIQRAQNGTTASAHSAGAQAIYKYWNPSGYAVTVDLGWRYSYAYKSRLGHKSCRAPFETNPDKVPSDTGGFSNLCPQIAFTNLPSDTVNIPQISIYRTTDGGGALYFLKDVTNTGSSISYEDNQLAGLAGTVNPQPDELLDSSNVAPSLISNLPPPPVAPPKTAGTDAIEGSSPLAYYAGRIWYWVNNYLFYSGDEEITEGIPEESFPGGTFGNFYRAKHAGVNVYATTEALYAWTAKDTYVVRGTDRKSFSFERLISGVGMAPAHPRAITAVGDKVIWLTQDYRVVAARGDKIVVLSDPLGTDLTNAAAAFGAEIELHYFAEREKEYIVVNGVNKSVANAPRQFVYDIKLSEQYDTHWWNTPWTIQNSAAVSDRVYESDARRYLVFFSWNGTSGQLMQWDSTEATVQDAGTNYAWDATFNLTENPPGNHVNTLRNPHLASVIYGFALERTKFASDTDHAVQWFKDDLWTTPITLTGVTPSRRSASLGYSTIEYKLNDAVQRAALKISKAADSQRFELQTLTYTFNPDGGA